MQANPGSFSRIIGYCGRFAPSPSGPLHFGSLVAALGSFLDARAHRGRWLLRIEDLDPPRVVTGAADTIRWQLEGLGLVWDEEIVYQSERRAAYDEAFDLLRQNGALYRCDCSRKQLLERARLGPEGPIYPGTCRLRDVDGQQAAWRLRTPDHPIICRDRLLGEHAIDVRSRLGDFIIRRNDGIYAYQLAVVVDDARQGVTDIVRGVDLWWSTPRQIWLQALLRLPHPRYLHLPLVKNAAGEKLSKQTLAPAIEPQQAVPLLLDALVFLGQRPPDALRRGRRTDVLQWAVEHWRPDSIPLPSVESVRATS